MTGFLAAALALSVWMNVLYARRKLGWLRLLDETREASRKNHAEALAWGRSLSEKLAALEAKNRAADRQRHAELMGRLDAVRAAREAPFAGLRVVGED